MSTTRSRLARAVLTGWLLTFPAMLLAHDVAQGDRAFVQSTHGPALVPFLYLGAKHMVTGYDHILFLIGVVFYLQRLKDVILIVSLFTLGHSLTLLGGVLLGIGANSALVDALIGLSVVYKGVENIGGFRRIGLSIDARPAVFAFGLIHGMGLATRLMDLSISREGLLANLVAFNLGVEIGQIIVLTGIVALLNLWRGRAGFTRCGYYANLLLIAAGLLLVADQTARYLSS